MYCSNLALVVEFRVCGVDYYYIVYNASLFEIRTNL